MRITKMVCIIIITTLLLLTGCNSKAGSIPGHGESVGKADTVIKEQGLDESEDTSEVEVVPEEILEDLTEDTTLDELTEEEVEMASTKADEFWDEPSAEDKLTKGYLLAIEERLMGVEAFWISFESNYLGREDAKDLPNYSDMLRYPDLHISKYVQLDSVLVKGVLHEEGDYYRLIIDNLSDGGWPTGVEGYKNPGDPRILVGDRVTIGGYFKGLVDYNSGFKTEKIPFVSADFIVPGGSDLKAHIAIQDWYENKIYAINYKRQLLTCFNSYSSEIIWQIPREEGYVVLDMDFNENGELLLEMMQNQLGSERFIKKISQEGEILSVE